MGYLRRSVMERYLVDGHEILCWPRSLSPSDCQRIGAMAPWPALESSQSIVEDRVRAQEIGFALWPFMPGMTPLRWLPSITMTRAYKVPWHQDQKKGAGWKLCLYLDEVDRGGTVFRSQDKSTIVRPPFGQGTIVLFDIQIEHRTDDYDTKKARRVLGLRAVSEQR